MLTSLPYTLLGLSSSSLPFKATAETKYILTLPPSLPLPLVSLLHTLAEPALLYKSLDDFVKGSDEGAEGGGLVGQALRSAIGNELRGYVELIGGLESQIRIALAGAERGESILKSGVTLKRCVVWTREATMGLRLMSLIVEKTRGRKGGLLISKIHTFASDHGDPFVRAFAERILTQIARPFYDMLRHWIYEGELTDPYVEFFVTARAVDQAVPARLALPGPPGLLPLALSALPASPDLRALRTLRTLPEPLDLLAPLDLLNLGGPRALRASNSHLGYCVHDGRNCGVKDEGGGISSARPAQQK